MSSRSNYPNGGLVSSAEHAENTSMATTPSKEDTMASKTPSELRAEAAAHRQAASDSFDRCDTDGFVTQWAHGVNAQKADLAASIAEQGGTWVFQGLYHRATGQRVKAKVVRCPGYYEGSTVSKWLVLDEADNAVAWLPAYKGGSKRSKLYKAGYEERDEVAPAVADLGGSGRGLSGALTVHTYARRTDGGYPEGALTPAQLARLERAVPPVSGGCELPEGAQLKRRDEVQPGDVVKSSHGYELLVVEVWDKAELRTDERHVQFVGHLHGDPACPTRTERYPAGSLVAVLRHEPRVLMVWNMEDEVPYPVGTYVATDEDTIEYTRWHTMGMEHHIGCAPADCVMVLALGQRPCTCEVADVGTGETGPMVQVVGADEHCPEHGREANPEQWAEGEAMERGYVLSGITSAFRGEPGLDPSADEDTTWAMYEHALQAVEAELGEDDGHHHDRAIGRVVDAWRQLYYGEVVR